MGLLSIDPGLEIRDQLVFITWGGSEEFRGGSLEIGLPKGGAYSLDDFVEGGGGSKNTYCPAKLAIHISNVS